MVRCHKAVGNTLIVCVLLNPRTQGLLLSLSGGRNFSPSYDTALFPISKSLVEELTKQALTSYTSARCGEVSSRRLDCV